MIQTIAVIGFVTSAVCGCVAVKRTGNWLHVGHCCGWMSVLVLAWLAMPRESQTNDLTRIDVRGLQAPEVRAVQSIAIGMLKRK